MRAWRSMRGRRSKDTAPVPPCELDVRVNPAVPTTRANPKSEIFATPPLPSSTLAALTSPWITERLCKNARAAQTSAATPQKASPSPGSAFASPKHARMSLSDARCSMRCSEPWGANSNIAQSRPSSSSVSAPSNATTLGWRKALNAFSSRCMATAASSSSRGTCLTATGWPRHVAFFTTP